MRFHAKAFIILMFSCEAIFSQNARRSAPATGEVDYSLYSGDVDKSVARLKHFLELQHIALISWSERNGDNTYQFKVAPQMLPRIDSLVETLGFKESKSASASMNNELEITRLRNKIVHLKEKKADHEKVFRSMDSIGSKNYTYYFERIESIKEEIYSVESELNDLLQNENKKLISIVIHDDYASGDNSDVTFVHMPGVEACILFPENPQPGITSGNYQGYSLKYVFTRGKSYFDLNVLKPSTPARTSDSSLVKDVFSLSFGQDFYNRHLGKGKRKFLNLYIGYHAGIGTTRSYSKDEFFFLLSPVIGLELFKNKYFNIDVNSEYFIPVGSYVYNLRGMKLNASFNFSF